LVPSSDWRTGKTGEPRSKTGREKATVVLENADVAEIGSRSTFEAALGNGLPIAFVFGN
jgi:hypothetical protein